MKHSATAWKADHWEYQAVPWTECAAIPVRRQSGQGDDDDVRPQGGRIYLDPIWDLCQKWANPG